MLEFKCSGCEKTLQDGDEIVIVTRGRLTVLNDQFRPGEKINSLRERREFVCEACQ